MAEKIIERTPVRTFTEKSTGCYADGLHGALHIRRMLAEILTSTYNPWAWGNVSVIDLVESLGRPAPDDCCDEDQAIARLSARCDSSCRFEMVSGDLMCIEVK